MTHKWGFAQADSIAAAMDCVPFQLLEPFVQKYMAERRRKFEINHGLPKETPPP